MELKIMSEVKHQISIKYAALLTLVLSLYSLPYHCHFTSNEKIIAEAPSALRWVLPLLL
jgi:hypothetical protein